MESKELTIQGINFNISTEIFDLLFFADGIYKNCIISRKSGQKIQKIANLQYYKSKANYGTKKKGISR